MNEMIKDRKGYLSGFALKIIAIITMTCDHIAENWWYECAGVWEMLPVYMRMIGKLTFPILVYLCAEGYHYTKDREAYAARLGLFALISMVPFYLVHGNPWNVLFTFMEGVVLLMAKEKIVEQFPNELNKLWMVLYGIVALVLSSAFSFFDWGFPGIFAIYVAGQVKDIRVRVFVPGMILFAGQILRCYSENILTMNNVIIYGGCLLSIGLLLLYNGQRGYNKSWWVKYLFYIYYPLHLMVIYWIKTV